MTHIYYIHLKKHSHCMAIMISCISVKKKLLKVILGIIVCAYIYSALWSMDREPRPRHVKDISKYKAETFDTTNNRYQDLELSSNINTDGVFCKIPEVVKYGQPYPECASKIKWMDLFWKSDSCYAKEGVNGTTCSFIEYLSTKESSCPPRSKSSSVHYSVLKENITVSRNDLSQLVKEFSQIPDMNWISKRILAMEKLWVKSATKVFSSQLAKISLQRKRIHLHLGLMSIGLGKSAMNGGPLGELVQWSDLIASLYIMGHEIVVTRTKRELIYVYTDYIYSSRKTTCKSPFDSFLFDLVYTDINGYLMLERSLPKFDAIKCKIRVLDSFGTEAEFNIAERSSDRDFMGLRLNLGQFNTMYPHTPDNTFLGFVVENPFMEETSYNTVKENIALVYGKDAEFWSKSKNYLDIVKEYVSEVHGTVAGNMTSLPPYVINHGVLPTVELYKLLQRTKVFVGLGFPFEGPAPLEAIAMGAIFINPKFNNPVNSDTHMFYKGKPTKRSIFSQNPYAEKYIGTPHVYTVDTTNEKELRDVLKTISESGITKPFLPYEYSAEGMLERVAMQVEKQNFCRPPMFGSSSEITSDIWPPISSLKVITTDSGNCNSACEEKNLICDPYYFPAINKRDSFEKIGWSCRYEHFPEVSRHIYPAFHTKSKTCHIQTHHLYFSCAASDHGFVRLCPCRDYMKEQVSICEHCLR